MAEQASRGVWSRAAAIAAQTPESRNRVVDFLRALSIMAVISGHWLLSAPYVGEDGLELVNLLDTQPWTRWLTWCFQVMPVFFFVGGYANSASWRAAMRDGRPYSEWLGGRLQRLIVPVLPLILAWAAVGAFAGRVGVSPEIVSVGSQVALVPIWFLSVYIVVVLLVPISHAAWERFGFYSFWMLAALAVIDDTLFFSAGIHGVGWLNYGFVWLAVHQLGYAWFDGRFSGKARPVIFGMGGLALLIGLVTVGPYPVSMVSVPGDPVSNSLPPKLPMLVLGIAQSGLLLALEPLLTRFLARPFAWTLTIVVNGTIMTIYLWHITASAFVMGLSLLLGAAGVGNVGLGIAPGSGAWWATRPVWIVLYSAVLFALLPLVGRFEHAQSRPRNVAGRRRIVGAFFTCAGLATLALGGVGDQGWLGLRVWAVLLPFLGAGLAGLTAWGERLHPGRSSRDNGV
jgi:hypothetical protein